MTVSSLFQLIWTTNSFWLQISPWTWTSVNKVGPVLNCTLFPILRTTFDRAPIGLCHVGNKVPFWDTAACRSSTSFGRSYWPSVSYQRRGLVRPKESVLKQVKLLKHLQKPLKHTVNVKKKMWQQILWSQIELCRNYFVSKWNEIMYLWCILRIHSVEKPGVTVGR